MISVKFGYLLRHFVSLLSVIVLLAASCSVSSAPVKLSSSVQVVLQSSYCNHKGAAVQWLDNRLAVAEALGRVRHNRRHTLWILRRLDFRRQGVVMIRIGNRPSSDAAPALALATINVSDQALRIRLSGRQSPPTPQQAQPATSQCLLVAVPRDDYTVVTVVDASGAVYGSAAVPEAAR